MVRKLFPGVMLHQAPENRVLCSYNGVVSELDGDLVIFLNNDIKVEKDFVDLLAGHFNDEKVMFAAPRLINFDGTYNGGRSRIEFSGGAVKIIVEKDKALEPGPTKAISTGAFRKKAFLEMGGFDDLYLPGIWEDVDLCYRGMCMGWKGVYEPRSVIWHDESTTFHKEYGKRGKMRIAHRNMYLFIWKNIIDRRMLISHVLLSIPRAVFKYFTGAPEILEGLIGALGKMPQALKKRKAALSERAERGKFSDREVMS
jgi:GT2 family glycosyltransferase